MPERVGQSTQATILKAAIVTVTRFQQNCTLLWDPATARGAVVDPGGDLDRIEAGIAQSGFTPELILLTHGHMDHAGGAAELKKRLRVPVVGPHVADRFLLDELGRNNASGATASRPVTPDRWLDE